MQGLVVNIAHAWVFIAHRFVVARRNSYRWAARGGRDGESRYRWAARGGAGGDRRGVVLKVSEREGCCRERKSVRERERDRETEKRAET